MRADHLTEDELRQYRQRKLPAPALLEADDHLAGCGECRRSLERMESSAAGDAALWRALTGAEPPELRHLSEDELVASVRNDWSRVDRQRVTEHLASCAECSADAEDLSRFRGELEAPGPRQPVVVAETRRHPWWIVPAWAGAAAVILLGILVGLRFYQRTTGPEAPVIAQLNDAGGAIKLDSTGRLVAPSPLNAADAATVKDALLSRRIEPPALLAQLASPPGTLLGGSTASRPVLFSPLGTAVVSDRPVFRWQPFGLIYTVSIYDGRYHKIAEGSSSQNQWQPDHALPRGKIYTWQITAFTKHQPIRAPIPPEPEARFEVLPQAQAEELEKIQQEYPDSHLLLGIRYAQAGALDDSERELTSLIASNPDSKIAKDLLASVRQLRVKQQ